MIVAYFCKKLIAAKELIIISFVFIKDVPVLKIIFCLRITNKIIIISNGIKEVNERYYSYNYLDDNLKTKEWHIGRIIYFINNPDRIDPIQIDNKCFGRCISGIPIIEDGNHRFMALLYLGMEDIKIDYCGRRDVLNYLMGITNEIPE